jgi:hypothetical protein
MLRVLVWRDDGKVLVDKVGVNEVIIWDSGEGVENEGLN